jgi:3-hydroxyacyl-[acyl-carrier-protein] dehydratase
MTPAEALRSLPHGPSFRFIDTILTLDPGHRVTAEYLLRGDEAFLPGHFPGEPLMPGVLLIEALAQAGGIAAQSDPLIPPAARLYLTAVRQAKITGSATPGERLLITAEVVGRMGGLVQIAGDVSAGGRSVLTAQVTLAAG